ncbi:uncharacterized protein [Physcomitrium patens]|uniref:Uncharacterized protein n=1 Tax=Physcomitrium patens TaxID=3218 RepID=A0A2K1IX94_PHYPA|nr:trafficking protein particle complex subunit 12-like [Physcomitrium patens]XP_024356585.1 trafficking protein particle complex subunit 12-like [Physcomitrium patens]PNR33894.1 hypothetical protein PHYPA_023710 [Physcomitrium patens]|eukprot:XP_024356584.1 trafficking protein particle complex subunit 12-like [Physcomitrella patens]
MEEQFRSSAMSGDNFSAFNSPTPNISQRSPLDTSINLPFGDTSSPSFKSVPISPSSASRLASLTNQSSPKPSFTSNIGQPWGLFQAEANNGPADTVRHPLMGHHPFSDEDEEDALSGSSLAKLPTASAASTTQTFSNSPEAVTSSRSKLNASPLSFSSRPFQGSSDISSLRKLARQGAWRALLDKVRGAKKLGVLTTPLDELNYATYHLLALMKLRSYGAAADELAAVGDLDAAQYRYEEYPSVYPDKSGSMVPFALRWMHAELPHRNGQIATTIERLYALLDFCNSRVESLRPSDAGSDKPPPPLVHTATDFSTNGNGDIASGDDNALIERVNPEEGTLTEEVGTSGEEEDFGEFTASDSAVTGNLLLTWMRRKEAVLFALVGHHLFQKQYIVALQWLNELLASSSTDADLLSRVGYVQLQLGDLGGAQQTFSKVDALISDTVDENLLNLAGRNRGLLHFADKQYAKAFNEFTTVLNRSPHDTISANNKALCLMYQRELLGATSVLEDSLQSSPRSTLSETMVLNLCSMYELASMNSVESKRSLSSWLLTHAPDDFDLSCTRL